MATGFSMFVVSGFRVPLAWALAAFLIGALVLAYPLIRTSRYSPRLRTRSRRQRQK